MTAPLPPPLPLLTQNLQLSPNRLSGQLLNVNSDPNSNESQSPQKEASIACQRLIESFPHAFILSWNRKIKPVLQDGPSCGIAAMCMASQLVSTSESHPTLVEIINLAKNRGFTKNGEMFSAANMGDLIGEVTQCRVELMNDGLSDRVRMINHLSSGHPALVPYDADKNHEPCCKMGHTAHWAVLTGVLLVVPFKYSEFRSSLTSDASCQRLYHMNSSENFLPTESLSSLSKMKEVEMYVFSRQGKSRHLSVWSYDALAVSNANLMQFNPVRINTEQFTIPAEGVSGGLCKRVILVKP